MDNFSFCITIPRSSPMRISPYYTRCVPFCNNQKGAKNKYIFVGEISGWIKTHNFFEIFQIGSTPTVRVPRIFENSSKLVINFIIRSCLYFERARNSQCFCTIFRLKTVCTVQIYQWIKTRCIHHFRTFRDHSSNTLVK